MGWLVEFPRPLLEREIAGALASAIDAHGPITRDNRASTAKRIVSTLRFLHRRLSKELPERIVFGGVVYERVVAPHCPPVTASPVMIEQMIEDAEWRKEHPSPPPNPTKETR